jgi:hypothetical protein
MRIEPDPTSMESATPDEHDGERQLPPAILLAALAFVIVLPTSMVVYDIVRDRTYIEFYDFRPNGLDGLWRIRCGRARGMTVEFKSIHPLGAVGKVRALGRSKKLGYRIGDEILRVSIDINGIWRGHILWRRHRATSTWRALKFRKRGRRLDGVSRELRCYEHLTRKS